MQIALLSFIAAFLLMSSLGVMLFYRQANLRRLSQIVSEASQAGLLRGIGAAPPVSKLERLVKPFQSILPKKPRTVSTAQTRLAKAGYRGKSADDVFYAAKVLVPGALCVLATVTRVYALSPLFVYALAAGLGYLAPDVWLSNRVKARQTRLRLGLPEALDLLVICVEAGLSIDRATMRAAEELQISQRDIADELNLVYLEQRAGRPRSEAWTHAAERTGVDTIRSLASILIQADKFGTSIGKTLRAHADTLRTQRRQDAEEKAAKTTVKLVFPLVIFIFPSLFVVTLGPAMIIMLDGFAKLLS